MAPRVYSSGFEHTDDPQFARIRHRIESLVLRVPEQARQEFAARLKSSRYTDFFSAYGELWFLDALETHGLPCTLAEATTSGSLPDLKIAADDVAFLGECHLRMQPEADVRNEVVQRLWFDATFRKLKDKRIRLWLHEVEYGSGSPSSARLAATLNRLAQESAVIEDFGPARDHGRFEFHDQQSGWRIDFTLMIRTAPATDSVAQLLYGGPMRAEWCQGENLLEEAITFKSRQHSAAALPTIICIGWNHFEHQPDLEDVINVVKSKRESLVRRSVHAIVWARAIYPWNENPSPPRLLHWDSAQARALVAAWKGPVSHVG